MLQYYFLIKFFYIHFKLKIFLHLLIEELTVFENLFYNAKLCFGNLNDKQIAKRVLQMLQSLGLYETKELKVGRFEWQVLDWNEPALHFYKKYGAHLHPSCFDMVSCVNR